MKKLKIVLMAAGIMLFAGCGNKVAQNSTDTGAEKGEAPKAEEKSAVSEVITSMQDAMASGQAMKCEYVIKDKDGKGLTTTAYVDGEKYMTTMEIAGKTQRMIFDGNAMYSWDEAQKQGMKMTLACTEELTANVPNNQGENAPSPPVADPEKTFENAMDVKCEPNSDADFSVPTDVTFTDQCEMLKNLTKKLPKGLPTDIPEGVVPPRL